MAKLSYKSAGVDVSAADAMKTKMADDLKTNDARILNGVGAFASLVDAKFPGFEHPVLVCKTEEPGSKQLLAFEHNRIEGICFDLVNHLINDIIVMGATPMFIQDLVVCGKLEPDRVRHIVKGIAKACKEQGCVLTGGETSEQPGTLAAGTYVLGASGIGVVEKSKIVDGSAIKAGDVVIAVESSGVHTNGYTLIRALLKREPEIIKEIIPGTGGTFLDAILTPHRCYYQCLKDFFGKAFLHGMAHITGGGIPGNLHRILPKTMDAHIDSATIKILPTFRFIKEKSGNDDTDMMQTYNLGVGVTLVIDPNAVKEVIAHIQKHDVDAYEIGMIMDEGTGVVKMKGKLQWK